MNKEVEQLLDLARDHHYHNIIFDLDKTITRLDLPWDEWEERVTAVLAPEASKRLSDMLAVAGAPSGEVINEQIMKDHEFYEQFIKICQEFEAEYFAHTPYDDLVKIIPQLKENGAELFIWTSNTRETAERALLEMGILQHFTQLVTREDVKLGKPHKEGWDNFAFTGAVPDSCLMIGDSQNDELAAKAVGMKYFNVDFFHQG
jgi:HAD superfamily hydrolase (TIGR01509 family)